VNPIPGPFLLLALPLLAAVIAYMLRRWALPAALLSAATAGTLALLCILLPLDRSAFVLGREVAFGRPVVVLGHNLLLDPAGQAWLALVFALAAILFLLAWRIPQGHTLFPLGLVILGLYALIALLQDAAVAVVVLGIGATLTVFIIQGGRLGSVRGAQRFLVISLLAVPLLLTAIWMGERSLLNAEQTALVRDALLPAALGFGLLLAAFPFGTWMPALAADAPPLITGFIFAAGSAMALFVTLLLFRNTPLSLTDPLTQTVFQLAGLVIAVLGGFIAAAQRDFGRLFGYAALSDLGYLLLALGFGSSQGLTLGLLHVANRAAALALAAGGLAILRHWAADDRFDALGGVARRLPIATAGMMLGLLALAGFPFTAGFATHWAVYRAMSSEQWIWAPIFLISAAGIAVGAVRGLSAMLDGPTRDDLRQPLIASWLLLGLMAVVLLLGIAPQLFLGPVQKAVEALALF